MTEKELKRLSRRDLLEMLIEQSVELQKTQEQLQSLEGQLDSRRIVMDEAGSIAEAALQLNGIFEAAQASCKQYIDNIKELSERQEKVCKQREEETFRKTAEMFLKAERRCAQMEKEARDHCAAMLEKARTEAERIKKQALREQNISDSPEKNPDKTVKSPRRRMWWKREKDEQNS